MANVAVKGNIRQTPDSVRGSSNRETDPCVSGAYGTQLAAALGAVHARIDRACGLAGRTSDSVRLIAVSKTFPATAIRIAAGLGQREFGENYLKEALDKRQALSDLDLVWHFIGPIQSNKTRPLAEQFDWVQGVDRLKIAQRLAEQRPPQLPPLNVLVQVNISGEASKSGCAPEQAAELCLQVARLSRLRLRGLMAIPAPDLDTAHARASFHTLGALFASVQSQLPPDAPRMDTLSAGMSDDLEAAIMEGSTMVRVGTAIFGART